MSNNIITQSEYSDWLRDTVTKALLEDLDNKCKDLMNMWSRAQFNVKGNAAASSELNAGGMASIEQLRNVIRAIEGGDFVLIDKGEDDNV